MAIQLLDTVAVVEDLAPDELERGAGEFPGEGLRRGQVGTVVEAYHEPEEAYEVEFVDDDGRTYALVMLLPSQLMVLHYAPAGQ